MVGQTKENFITKTQRARGVNTRDLVDKRLSKLIPRKEVVSRDEKDIKKVEGPCSNTKVAVL